MKVVFYKFSDAQDLFARLNRGLGYTLERCDYIAEFVDNGQSVGISSFTLTPYAVYVDIYAPGFQLTRDALRQYLKFAFALRPRVAAIVSSKNYRCQKLLSQIGFVREGCLRTQFDGVADEIHFGMQYAEYKKSPWFCK